jgi:DNA-binding CsgD family transcriptional regulator
MRNNFKIVAPKQHLAFATFPQVEKVAKKLFAASKIKYFSYQRFFPNRNYTFLPSSPELGSYFFKDGAWISSWLSCMPFNNYHNGIMPWDLAHLCTQPFDNQVTSVIETHLDLKYGIDIIEKHAQHCDIYCFASNEYSIYLCQTDLLRKFIHYFWQEMHETINSANLERIDLKTPANHPQITLPIINTSQQTNNDKLFDLQRYYLRQSAAAIYLTEKEKRCLECIANGESAKTAARSIGMSNRTFETHLNNIKRKMHCHKIGAIVKQSIKNHIIC